MVKKMKNESSTTILIIMIITFLACSFLLLFFINYLDQIYIITESNRLNQEGLGSSSLFISQATNPIFRSKEILEARLGLYGTILFFVIILLLIISGVYIVRRIIRKIKIAIMIEDEFKKMDISVKNKSSNKN